MTICINLILIVYIVCIRLKMVNLKKFWLSSLPETYPIYSTLGTIIDFVGFHCVLPNLLIGNPKAIHSDISPCRCSRPRALIEVIRVDKLFSSYSVYSPFWSC